MSEADTCRKYITPALQNAGWENPLHDIREQEYFTDGRLLPVGDGDVAVRGERKFADYILYYQRDFKLAVVEAKEETLPAETGMQQAMDYAQILGLHFAYATNGKRIIEHDFTTGIEREILEYFTPAYQLGMTATPLREDNRDTYAYFGDPIYTYSLAQGIEDGFLAPYRVHDTVTNVDALSWRPQRGQRDRDGQEIPDKLYATLSFDNELVLKERTETIAEHLTGYLKATNRFAKTIVFCVDQEHAARMRQALNNLNTDLDQLRQIAKQPDADPFDLLCHLAFKRPLQTRRERASRFCQQQATFLAQYTQEARVILEELLDKYADHGLAQFTVPDVLKVPPIADHGNVSEIAHLFGGADCLKDAIAQLQTLLYAG